MSDPRPTEGLALTLFERHVKQALRFLDDPERLGKESPLASPYMLSRALRELPRSVSAHARGTALREVMRAAAARLWGEPLPASRPELLAAITLARRDPDTPRYAYLVLDLRCFHSFVTPNKTSDIWEQEHLLPGSKSQHYRDFDAAVKALAPLLLDDLRPALRPERVAPPQTLYGYQPQLALLVAGLAQPQTALLSGPGGVGKTSLAAAALQQLGERPLFWYTLRPGFNDGVSSVLFALGAFLHELGAPNLWQYLAASGGVIGDLNLAAGLLRQDLATLAERQPVLCFDDLEHLVTASAPGGAFYAQLLELIDGLRGSAALLLISQRPLLSADLQLQLGGLERAELERFWRDAGRSLAPGEAAQLYAYTGGNLRLLTLLLAAQPGDGPLFDAEEAVPSLLPAFQRLWRRLTAAERRALQGLSVYQGFAPAEVLDAAVAETLARLRLIEHDGLGGVTLLPALAPLIRDELAPEQRMGLHREAAVVRLERAEYTAAAYHFVEGGQAAVAVQVWFPQRRHALARGEADAARAIFAAIVPAQLAKTERKALDLIQAELHQLAGQSAAGLHQLDQVDWLDDSEASARLWMLRGELEDALGYPERALTSYGEGLQIGTRLLGQLSALHQRRGGLFRRQRDLRASWDAIHRAEFDLEMLRGLVREAEGAYDDALEAYGRALALAEQLGDDAGRAQAERGRATVYGRRQQSAAAVRHAMAAAAIYERLGDRVNLEQMRSNLAAIYVQARQFQEALAVGEPAYSFFVAVQNPYFAAVTGANLAEAAYESGDLAGAERYARAVLTHDARFAAPYAYFTLGQIALAQTNGVAASDEFRAAMELAQQNDDSFMVAYAMRALGQAQLALGEQSQARAHMRAARDLFRELGIAGEVAATEELLQLQQL